MADIELHPTVRQFRKRHSIANEPQVSKPLHPNWLRQICLEAGADDVGFVEIGRPELEPHLADIRYVFPETKALISFVCKMNRENVRTPARSVSNLEFHHTVDETNEVARRIVCALDQAGVRAVNGGAAGFPMEADRAGVSKIWLISHKPIAVAAGLGKMGIHRNVIHPKFGNFILLGTVLVDVEIKEYAQPLDYNPCLECKLCVAACPTGAIAPDGHFDFSACYTHNYREFLTGFNDWVETIADSSSAADYRKKVSASETVSMWQSLSFGANYKAAYCLAVCPAGENVIAPFLLERKQFINNVLRPLQEKVEPVYVVPNSDAEEYVARRFPHKKIRRVSNGLSKQGGNVRSFLRSVPIVFQRGKSEGLNAIYHFVFVGAEQIIATIKIQDKTIQVSEGLTGTPDLQITAESETWLRFLRKELSMDEVMRTGEVHMSGSPKLLMDFGRCFPS